MRDWQARVGVVSHPDKLVILCGVRWKAGSAPNELQIERPIRIVEALKHSPEDLDVLISLRAVLMK